MQKDIEANCKKILREIHFIKEKKAKELCQLIKNIFPTKIAKQSIDIKKSEVKH